MAHIFTFNEFINESRGAALKDRTPDRFIKPKEGNTILKKQWMKVFTDLSNMFNYNGDEVLRSIGIKPLENIFWLGAERDALNVGLFINKESLFEINDRNSWDALTNSQKNALSRIGIKGSYQRILTNGEVHNEHDENNRVFFKWLLREIDKKYNSIPCSKCDFDREFDADYTNDRDIVYAYMGALHINTNIKFQHLMIGLLYNPTCSQFSYNDNIDYAATVMVEDFENANSVINATEYKKNAIEFYKGVVKLIWKIISDEKKRILG